MALVDDFLEMLGLNVPSGDLIKLLDSSPSSFAVKVGKLEQAPASFPIVVDFDLGDSVKVASLRRYPGLPDFGEWRVDELRAFGAMAFASQWVLAAVEGRLLLISSADGRFWRRTRLGVVDPTRSRQFTYGIPPTAGSYRVVRAFAPIGQSGRGFG